MHFYYEHGKRRLEKNGRANTWCNLTRKWLRDLGLEEEWKQQAVGPAWQERLKEKIMEYEARNWRRRVVREDNVKLKDYGKWKVKPELEQYLQHEDVHQRRLWTKLRGGILELRVETGRWERMSLGGRQEGAAAAKEVQVVLWRGGGCEACAVPMPGLRTAAGGDGSGDESAGHSESCGRDGECGARQEQRGGGGAVEVDDGGRRREGRDGGVG